ncbi:MAG: hypothetical protein ACRDSH_04285 [Pseudonocardiaceae bacterium]
MLIVIILVVVGAALLLSACRRRRRRGASVRALYRAASEGDAGRLRQRGVCIDQQDSDRNTALHLAYYDRREHTVACLIEACADADLRNREGLTAPEMAELAAIEELLERGARCLGSTGSWFDANTGRVVYDELQECSPHIYNPAIVRRVLESSELRRSLLYLVIKLGIAGSEEKLVEVLRRLGTKEIAVDYLNAGSDVLRVAAEKWARQNNYRIYRTGGRWEVAWGRF